MASDMKAEDYLVLLREKAMVLDQATADLNALIEKREKEVNDTGIGVEASVELGPGEEFGFGKRTGHWGFFIDTCGNAIDLRRASRQIRVRAMAEYPRLLAELCRVADELIAKAESVR